MKYDDRYDVWFIPIPAEQEFYYQIRVCFSDFCEFDKTGCLDSGLL